MHTNDDERKANMANPAAKYTDEFRRETADYVISTGRPISECCGELGLNSKAVNQWVIKRRRELSGRPDPKVEDRELREARKRIRELEMENAFLKKAAAFFAIGQIVAPQIQINPLAKSDGVAVATRLPVAGHARLRQQPLALIFVVSC